MSVGSASVNDQDMSGVFNQDLIENLSHYRQIIVSQGMNNTSARINPCMLSNTTDGTTIWSRITNFKTDPKFSNSKFNYHWKKEEKLVSYFLLENDDPDEYIVYQEKKFNMLTGKMMYFKMLVTTPAVLKLYNIKL